MSEQTVNGPPPPEHSYLNVPTAVETASVEHIRRLINRARAQRTNAASHTATATANPPPAQTAADIYSLRQRMAEAAEFVPTPDWGSVVLWQSWQTTLRRLCDELHLPGPYYEGRTQHFDAIGNLHMYFIFIPPGPDSMAEVAGGRLSADAAVAREDAASAMIGKVLRRHGFILATTTMTLWRS
ncbi:hypothetical protein PIB30_000427 [Stylosanthes scabra]|uniref:Uncharacterized protein n=1 Tax=Stylosanthes scabra TaxID=79078 RepID=A0ABU6V0N7_9FABA|nr:hypothetical protein [Stylosanthes scabra]